MIGLLLVAAGFVVSLAVSMLVARALKRERVIEAWDGGNVVTLDDYRDDLLPPRRAS